MMLPRDKNVDLYEILMNLDDISLLNFCKASFKQEYEKSLCADETFWKLRTKNYYPVAHEIKKDDLKWKKYYLRIVYYKDKMEREYGFGFTDGDAKEYYDILKYLMNYEGKIKFVDFTTQNRDEFYFKKDKYPDLNNFLKKMYFRELLHDDYDYSNTFFLPIKI